MSISDKFFNIIAPIRIYSRAATFAQIVTEFSRDLRSLFGSGKFRKAPAPRLFIQTCLGISFFPLTFVLYLARYRAVYGNSFDQIGDVAFLDALIKREFLLKRDRRLVLVLGSCKLGNRPLVKKYSEYVKIVEWPSLWAVFWSVVSYSPLLQIDVTVFSSACENSLLSKINRLWAKKGLKPLLKPEPFNEGWNDIPSQIQDKLREGKFVCVHSRDSGFYGDVGRSTRNYNIQTLIPIIQKLVESEIAVVRIGSRPEFVIESEAFNSPNLYFDSCDIASAELDVFLLSNCMFFIGCGAGPAEVPMLFGRNVFLVNAYPTIKGRRFLRGDVSIFKKFKNSTTGSYLSFPQYFDGGFDKPLQRHELMKLGYELEDNSPEEMLLGFGEFIYRNRGAFPALFDRLISDKEDVLEYEKLSTKCKSDNFLKRQHWTFRSSGIFSELFITQYVGQDIRMSGDLPKVGDQ